MPMPGTLPSVEIRKFAIGYSAGMSAKMPQNPYTTDGMAASRSTRYDSGLRSQDGATSVMNNATATATGTAITMPISEVSTVPYTNCRMPYGLGWVPVAVAFEGAHRSEVMKLSGP